MLVRKAEPADLKPLNDLMRASKGYWGYDSAFMDGFMSLYSLTELEITSGQTFVAALGCNTIGFYYFAYEENADLVLDKFFLHPNYIARGNGKLLWKHCVNTATHYGAKEFTLWSDPNTEGFYLKMGCVKIGERKSPMPPDRYPPIMKYSI
jgi:streptomycin 6-kinase